MFFFSFFFFFSQDHFFAFSGFPLSDFLLPMIAFSPPILPFFDGVWVFSVFFFLFSTFSSLVIFPALFSSSVLLGSYLRFTLHLPLRKVVFFTPETFPEAFHPIPPMVVSTEERIPLSDASRFPQNKVCAFLVIVSFCIYSFTPRPPPHAPKTAPTNSSTPVTPLTFAHLFFEEGMRRKSSLFFFKVSATQSPQFRLPPHCLFPCGPLANFFLSRFFFLFPFSPF